MTFTRNAARRHAAAWAIAVVGLAHGATAGAARIVTLAPHLAELVCDAGACGQLVGVSDYSDYPAKVAALPRVGDGFSVSAEAVLALRPDWVLAWTGGTPAQAIARLRSLGLRVESLQVERLDSVAPALRRLGQWLHTEPAAEAAATRFERRLSTLHERWRERPPLRVAYQIGTSPAYTISRRSPISDVLAACGGVNIFADLDGIAAPVGAETLLKAHPQAVLFAAEEGRAPMQAYWARLPANEIIAKGTLYPVNANWLTRATPRMLDGMQQVCEALDDARRRLSIGAPERGD